VVAITDDGHCVQNHELMRRAVEYARMVGLPVLDHCQDYNLVGNGVVERGLLEHAPRFAGLAGGGRGSDLSREIFCSLNFAIITFIVKHISAAEACGSFAKRESGA